MLGNLARTRSAGVPHWIIGVVVCLVAFGAHAQPNKGAKADAKAEKTIAEITAMLNTFLSPAQNPTAAAHDRFWAEDLIYTTSAGVVKTKPDIMKSFAEKPVVAADKPAPAASVYSAEDILVRPYGTNMAALTFRLVGREPDGSVNQYRNSGTFLLRNGKWQVITWQATKVAKPTP